MKLCRILILASALSCAAVSAQTLRISPPIAYDDVNDIIRSSMAVTTYIFTIIPKDTLLKPHDIQEAIILVRDGHAAAEELERYYTNRPMITTRHYMLESRRYLGEKAQQFLRNTVGKHPQLAPDIERIITFYPTTRVINREMRDQIFKNLITNPTDPAWELVLYPEALEKEIASYAE